MLKKILLLNFTLVLLLSLISCNSDTVSSSLSPKSYRGSAFIGTKDEITYMIEIDNITHDKYQLSNYFDSKDRYDTWFTFIGDYYDLARESNEDIADYYYSVIPHDKVAFIKRRANKENVYYDNIQDTVVGYFSGNQLIIVSMKLEWSETPITDVHLSLTV